MAPKGVPKHGVQILTLEAEERVERILYEAETAYLSNYQELTNNQVSETAIYESRAEASGGMVASWLGHRADNDIQWKNVYSRNGGKYKMTLAYFSGESRNLVLEVNGKEIKSISLNSGGWTDSGTYEFEIELNQGENNVRLYNGSGWMPDIDYMLLEKRVSTTDIKSVNEKSKSNVVFSIDGKELHETGNGIIVEDGIKMIIK